ncbi:phosphoethanolamine transferase [Pseudomonas aeruginosa]|jgi:lipid A ethanolaminephosphotransferase|uniref:Phosphoethanolamine transferase n=1 Tax=Pseudomonas putida TaxID=303 RepID=A0A2S3WZC4_PSEPU|nr:MULTISPECIES: phosphoethanolamine--lipid A transferase [Pseudomonas]MDD2015957.1 phosphoethanolamine--lipid A transferase [Pseudomonas putida]POG06846.1 phosphoethanolamine transferase [Pseudomonas putida]HDS1771298.1 phosphoethanolamine--lipid A transferase [Pseudomonas putida]
MDKEAVVSQSDATRNKGLNPVWMIVLVALWMTLAVNTAFWSTVWRAIDGFGNGNPLFLISLPIFVMAWHFIILWALCWGRLLRPMLAILIVIASVASYFISRYGIVIDASMLMNMLQTDPAEARDLLSFGMLFWLLATVVLPIVMLYRLPLGRPRWRRQAVWRLGSLALVVALVGVVLATQYQSYASLLRNNRDLRLILVPSNVLGAVHSYAKRTLDKPQAFVQVGTDAHQRIDAAASGRHKLMVVVVGETARAMNFSLNGYERDTNPELARRNVLSFKDVSSCGTATAISVPCMFQDLGRKGWKDQYANHREGLLDVLQRAGIDVLWRDNNSGCKGACDRVPNEDLSHARDAQACSTGECFDEVLLSGLQGYLDQRSGNTVVVLHMKGSHGPSYYKRYPAAFERFTPVCRDNQLDQCEDQTLRNAYDNTLLYTDHVLAQLIDLLKHNGSRFDSAMLYVSDHGESLGEKGVYLHGLPYAMAPAEQTHVPMVLWMSQQLATARGISLTCLGQRTGATLSHDNLFHSVLGIMDVQTTVYRDQLDMFRPCQSGRLVKAEQGVGQVAEY